MAVICPTIMPTVDDPHVFRGSMERLGTLAPRLQIDLMDGDFAPHRNTTPNDLWWPRDVQADIHLMYLYPEEATRTLLTLRPHMIIVHAETHGDLSGLMRQIRETGIKTGIALLRTTTVDDVHELLQLADHVLLFGGTLGGNGIADLSALEKVAQIRAFASDNNASIEIGWDGGANEGNVALIAGAGVDVINVGAALRDAEDPATTYRRLCELAA